MSCDPTTFDHRVGGGSSVDREAYKSLITHLSGSGSPVGSLVPAFIGQEYFDAAGEAFYKATGLTNADWKQTTA